MSEKNKKDQAASLRNKVATNTSKPQLPPRSELHSQKKGKTKWKVSPGLLRIVIIFLLLAGLIGFILW
ncbi:hypothetical protein [Gracilibacillus timonensis]|uniref:hypothetical protein n=1 Tax=Gracilibacillus timonensis TaxID=1816696 RepID=UPI0008253277|nr:hypothetical protein [Gracilibacillus timonensis]